MGKKNKKKRSRESLEATTTNPSGSSSNNNSKNASSKESEKPLVSTKRSSVSNPLLDRQEAFLKPLSSTERNEIFSPDISIERRAELWTTQADLGEELVNKYAWATPNEAAIRIIKHFSPLVEIGCGSNAYWCRLLRQAGVDIVGYDVDIQKGGTIGKKGKKQDESKSPFYLKQGGPTVLASRELQKSGRTLFLCYPDENEPPPEEDEKDVHDDDDDSSNGRSSLPTSLAWQCLHNYTGDYVIHVGELFLDANYCMPQSPWGRSSSPEFQQRLASEYHCLLKCELPNWLHTRDTISVWKRSQLSTMVFAKDDDDEEGDPEEEEEEEEEEEVEYRHIPVEERLPINIAAPCLAHLLPTSSDATSAKKQSIEVDTNEPSTKRSRNEETKNAASPIKDDDKNKRQPMSKIEPTTTTTPSSQATPPSQKKHKKKKAKMENIKSPSTSSPAGAPSPKNAKKYVTPW